MQLTEALLVSFSERLDGNYTIGQALRLAKNSYLAEVGAGSISVYDEKSSQQAILFGLPFSTPDVASPPPAPVAPPSIVLADPDGTGELFTGTVGIDVEFEPRVTDRGTVLEIDGRSFAPAENPLQPIVSVDATGPDADGDGVPDQRLHGALLRSGVAYTFGTIDPIYQTPTINGPAREPELQPLDAVFPISPLAVSDADTEFGPRDFVVAQPGRFTATQPDGTGTQVLYDDLSVQTLHSDSDDWVAPTIGKVTQAVSGGALGVTVSTSSTDVAGVVVAVVENLPTATAAVPAAWRTFDLAATADGRWSGGIALGACTTERLQYLVQIYDTAGNVRVMSNKASGFTSSCVEEPEPEPDPALTTSIDSANLDSSGWYTGPVTVTVDSTLTGLTYSLDGAAPVALPASKQFTITGDGIRTYTVRAASSSSTSTRTVKIDAGGAAPVISIVAPIDPVEVGSNFVFTYRCADSSLITCNAVLTPPGGLSVPYPSGQSITAVEGTYLLTVTSDDAVSTTGPSVQTATVVAEPVFVEPVAPTISTISGPTVPAQLGTQTEVSIEFADGNGPNDDYTVTFDWGVNLLGQTVTDDCVATSTGAGATPDSNCSLVEPTLVGNGSATGTVIYPEPGVYTVTVTVDDSSGLPVAAATHEFVVIFDPGGGRVAGSGIFWSDNASYFGNGPRWGTIATCSATTPGTAMVHRRRSARRASSCLAASASRSTAYDYLVVNDTVAVTEGVGKLNGQAGYRMRVQGIDNGRYDFFQITIWNDSTEEIIYDNGTSTRTCPTTSATIVGDRVLLGGIVVRG